jgi:hypothetical protein
MWQGCFMDGFKKIIKGARADDLIGRTVSQEHIAFFEFILVVLEI